MSITPPEEEPADVTHNQPAHRGTPTARLGELRQRWSTQRQRIHLWSPPRLDELSALFIQSAWVAQRRRRLPWSAPLVRRLGLRVSCRGPLRVISHLISSLIKDRTLSLSPPQRTPDGSWSTWVRIKPAGSLTLNELNVHIEQTHEHHDTPVHFEVYEPIGTQGKLWRALTCHWILRPDVDDEFLEWIESRLNQRELLITQRSAEVASLNLTDADDSYQAFELAIKALDRPTFLDRHAYLISLADRIDEVAPPHVSRVIDEPSAHDSSLRLPTPRWTLRRDATPLLGLLFSSMEAHQGAITHLVHRRGPEALEGIMAWLGKDQSGQIRVAWSWSEIARGEVLADELRSFLIGQPSQALCHLELPLCSPLTPHHHLSSAMTPSTARHDEHDLSALVNTAQVWLSHTHTLTPLPPALTLLRWCGLDPSQADALRGQVWITHYAHGQGICVTHLEYPPLDLRRLLTIEIDSVNAEALEIFRALRTSPVTLNRRVEGSLESALSSPSPGLSSSNPYRSKDTTRELPETETLTSDEHTVIETRSRDVLYDAHSESASHDSSPQLEDTSRAPQSKRDDQHGALLRGVEAAQALRAELRSVTHPHAYETRSLRERAQRWLSQLEVHAPQLVAHGSAYADWITLAQNLWWVDERTRALDALTWAMLTLEMNTSASASHPPSLTGWVSRLSEPVPHETHLRGGQRRALLCLAAPQDHQGQGPQRPRGVWPDHQELVALLELSEESDDPLLHIHWLFYRVWVSDTVTLQRGRERSAHALALSLNPEHLDPALIHALERRQHLETQKLSHQASDSEHSAETDLEYALSSSDLSSPTARLRLWSMALIDVWLAALRRRQDTLNHKTLGQIDALVVSLRGLRMILDPQPLGPWSLHDAQGDHHLSALARLYVTTPPLSKPERVKLRARLQTWRPTEIWSRASVLSTQRVEETPLLVSRDVQRRHSPQQGLSEAHRRSLIPISELASPIRVLLRRMRSVIHNYYSLREVLNTSINDALKRGDRAWLRACLDATQRWSTELAEISTAPRHLAPLVELDRIRIWCALADQGPVEPLVDRWISRWFGDQTFEWSVVRSLGQAFALHGLEALSELLSPTDLLTLITHVRASIIKSLKAERDHGTQTARSELEWLTLDLLIQARSLSFASEECQEVIQEECLKSARAFIEGLTEWVRHHRETLTSQHRPLTSWSYHLLSYPLAALRMLIEQWSCDLEHLNARDLSELWYVLEDMIFASTLFETRKNDAIQPRLRAHARWIRSVWRER